jgi:hypothetical protein
MDEEQKKKAEETLLEKLGDKESRLKLGMAMSRFISDRWEIARKLRFRTPIQQISDEDLDRYEAQKKAEAEKADPPKVTEETESPLDIPR